VAVAGQINEAQVGVLPVDVRQADEAAESIPASIFSAREESRRGRIEIDEIEVAVTGEIEELLPPATQRRQRGTRRYLFDRTELAFAKIVLVVPGIGLFAEHT